MSADQSNQQLTPKCWRGDFSDSSFWLVHNRSDIAVWYVVISVFPSAFCEDAERQKRSSSFSFIDVYIGTTETESCNVRANCGEGIKGDFLAWVGKKKHPSLCTSTPIPSIQNSMIRKWRRHDTQMTKKRMTFKVTQHHYIQNHMLCIWPKLSEPITYS